ncbi:MAG: hypothetical protein HGA27_08430 [Peptococcaceae bacterium]|nr:hypothetical protein [Peptococcaceae bacterium]
MHNTVNNLPSQPPAPPGNNGNNGNNGHNSNNSPPAALEVTINGTAAIGETLTADYIYLDPEHNPEGNTIFAWYRGTIQDGSDKTVIQASVEDQYTVTQDDLDKYLFVQVTPVAHSGSLVGQPVLSPATELVVSVADAEIVSYRIVTQQDPDGPTFDFNSLVEDDTAEYYSHTDDDFIEIPIGFDFSFYNGTYNQVFVSTNGYLTFGEGSDEYSNYSFPSTGSPIIAPFFDDLIANQETAGVYYKVIGSEPNRKLVVQWYLEDQYEETPNTVDLQAILFEGSNEILFLYNDTTFGTEDDNGASATIGISLGDGETALQLSYNAASVFDQDVILLTPGSLLAPSDLEVSSNSDLDGIYNELLWDDSPSQGLLYYTVKRNTINSLLNAETLADTIPGGSQAYSDFTAEPGQTYYYFVQVTDGSEIITSNCIEVTTSEENPGDNENIVTFNDAYLEEEIREQLEIPEAEITVEDMANLSYLSMVESDVSDLTGLEYAVNLGTLVISCTPLEDISALAGLANLVELDLSYNNIVDISDLGGLTNLQYLDLSHNAISDISALAGLVNLIELDFSHNQVMDITPLLANEGFGAGDTIDLTYNNLDPYSNEIGILVNTGATVYYLEQNFEAH